MTLTPSTRTAVITGAAARNGIGFHAARRMAGAGWSLALLDLNGEAAASAADAIADEFGVATTGRSVDVTDEESVASVMEAVAGSDLPPIGALLNIAGIPSPCPFLDLTLQEWNTVVGVNLTGTFLMAREVLPEMIEQGSGRIVNMSSVSAQQGGGVYSKTSYSAAKAGVLGLTRSLAREMAEHNITVNAICPGVVDTGIRAAETNEENERQLAAAVPLGRQGTPDEIGALCAWLASPDAGYITGATHNINGGSYIA
ncbi:SDR family NAD(P)-dependent oxidoreductase [Brevibacterium sp.]|uniref:SDR family NAD(P)-dependent oxidoreductase n=1 Tax=Brevibacterium sp. TaxID=1701 RepID=UPI002810E536|nr:SDR family NAD(P)-dependent oxidoreductase [Brevibacterium sp.]